MKVFKKIALYLLGTILVLVVSLLISVFLFKDRIIQQFINEANKSLNTPVRIARIDISAFRDFPNMAIVLEDVYIEDSHPGDYPLATAHKIFFSLNPIEMWRGNYRIKGLRIDDCETNLKINAAGVANYVILKETAESENKNISFNLKDVRLNNIQINYTDHWKDQHHQFTSEKLLATVTLAKNVYKIIAKGDITCGQIGIGNRKLLVGKTFDVNAHLDYDDKQKQISIDTSRLKIDGAVFTVSGNYFFKEKSSIDLTASGQETTLRNLLSLLPQELTKLAKEYKSEGDVYFNLHLKGEISARKSPFISINFGFNDATFTHPQSGMKIEHANLEGSYASSSVSSLDRSELFLKKITGELNGKSFTSNLSIQNFNRPLIDFDFRGELEANSLGQFFPLEDFKNLSGNFKADVSLMGEIELLKKKATAQQVKISGTIDLSHIHITYGKEEIELKDLNGALQFNNNDLALSNVSGHLGESDFLLNGFFKNIVTYLLFEDQPIGIETDLKSEHLDLDKLFAIGFGTNNNNDFRFSISPNVHFNFNCDIGSLNYKKLKARHVKGDLLIKNQMAVSRHFTFDGLGGSLTMNGILDARNPKAIDISTAFQIKEVNIDSVFYVFENFYQDFIQDKHLKGNAFADVNLEMTLNEKLNLYPETLVADISATIKNGELNNFEPLQALKKYLDDEGLNKLRFADLKNEIHIENKTIYIPQMEIKSNVTTIQLSGTHSFDQKIDYRVVAPLRSRKKIDPDEAFGAIEEDAKGQTKLFLKITGTTNQYEVSLDKEAVKKKIASDLKKEIQELKDAFKNKGKKKKKELELEKDDYFDWNRP